MKSIFEMVMSKLDYNPKITAILIIGFCLFGILIGNYVERYRISNYRLVYEYGNHISFVTVYGSLIWSFFHPIIIWSRGRVRWRKTQFGFLLD
ncbi:hypothetical protein GTQ40_14825 [Flavobacteriaceae bacterium R38]|nr:hypothetical protein [Flavobacteriaceae bacterium R38]